MATTFGENIKRLRMSAGLKANALADRLGVKPSVVSGWENNKTGLPETGTVFRLAKALNVSIEDLLAGIDPEYDAQRDLARQTIAEESPSQHNTQSGGDSHGTPQARHVGDGPASAVPQNTNDALREIAGRLLEIVATRQTAEEAEDAQNETARDRVGRRTTGR